MVISLPSPRLSLSPSNTYSGLAHDSISLSEPHSHPEWEVGWRGPLHRWGSRITQSSGAGVLGLFLSKCSQQPRHWFHEFAYREQDKNPSNWLKHFLLSMLFFKELPYPFGIHQHPPHSQLMFIFKTSLMEILKIYTFIFQSNYSVFTFMEQCRKKRKTRKDRGGKQISQVSINTSHSNLLIF